MVLKEKLLRYTPEQIKVIEQYWDTLRFTRKTGQIADGIKEREYEYWERFDPVLVIEALTIHIRKYPNIRENYTRGILRNLKGGASFGSNGKSINPKHGTAQNTNGTKRDERAEEAFRRRLAGL